MGYKIPKSSGLTSPMGGKLKAPKIKSLKGQSGVSGNLRPPKRGGLSSPIGDYRVGRRTTSKKFKEVLG